MKDKLTLGAIAALALASAAFDFASRFASMALDGIFAAGVVYFLWKLTMSHRTALAQKDEQILNLEVALDQVRQLPRTPVRS